MKIIIVGCGKVGTTLAEQLNNEHHDITVIDKNTSVINAVTERIDVMGVVGNGAVYKVQMEAGIQDTDLLIATTNSDELNMLCCLIAKKAGNCHTIARIRNPEYSTETRYIREELGLSMAINPEMAAAMEISRLLRFPSAIKIDTFAKGRIEILKFLFRRFYRGFLRLVGKFLNGRRHRCLGRCLGNLRTFRLRSALRFRHCLRNRAF